MPATHWAEVTTAAQVAGDTTNPMPTTLWLALYSTAPYVNDTTYGTEVGVARQSVAWNNAATPTYTNNATITFSSLPGGNILGLALLDDATTGKMWFYVDLTSTPISTTTGGSLSFAPGDVVYTVST